VALRCEVHAWLRDNGARGQPLGLPG
jgi:hypothetical protein